MLPWGFPILRERLEVKGRVVVSPRLLSGEGRQNVKRLPTPQSLILGFTCSLQAIPKQVVKLGHGSRGKSALSIILSWRVFLIFEWLFALLRTRTIHLSEQLALLPFALVGYLFEQDICKLNGFIESLLCLIVLLYLLFVLVMIIRFIRLKVLE